MKFAQSCYCLSTSPFLPSLLLFPHPSLPSSSVPTILVPCHEKHCLLLPQSINYIPWRLEIHSFLTTSSSLLPPPLSPVLHWVALPVRLPLARLSYFRPEDGREEGDGWVGRTEKEEEIAGTGTLICICIPCADIDMKARRGTGGKGREKRRR